MSLLTQPTSTPMPPTVASDAARYTTAPRLHPFFVLGSLQLLGWLLLQPHAWQSYVARIDPALAPQFCLAELNGHHWRNPALQRLLVLGYGVLPLLGALLLGLTGVPLPDMAYALAVGFGFGLPLSVAVGAGVSIPSILLFVLVVGWTTGGPTDVTPVTFSVLGGVAGALAGRAAPSQAPYSLTRQIGGSLAGVAVAGLLIGLGFGLLALFNGSGLGGVTNMETSAGNVLIAAGLDPHLARGSAWGIATFLGGGGALAVTIWARTRAWRRALAGGVLAGLGIGGGVMLGYQLSGLWGYGEWVANNIPIRLGSALHTGVFFCFYFLLNYAVAAGVAGPLAGGVAGALGGAAGWETFWTVSLEQPVWQTFPSSLLAALVGLTILNWRPVLVYPLEVAWGTLLYYLDRRRSRSPSLLPWHPACWDADQALPLGGLDDYLVLVALRDPAEGQAALAYLAEGYQRWAVQAAQIELDARPLEACTDVQAIRAVSRQSLTEPLQGPGNALLRSFRRISQDVDAALHQQSSYNQRLALSAVEDRLDELVRELNRSNERYAGRFYPIALHWRQVVNQAVAALAATSELRQEIDNPYIIGLPLTAQQEIFVGRTDISARIEHLLVDRRRPPLLLYGQRRMGKTSLLHNLSRLLPSTIIPLFVDLQGAASQAADHAGFLYSLAGAMRKAAQEQRGLVFPPLAYARLRRDPFPFFDQWLDAVEGVLDTQTALLELDEFETLDLALREGRLKEAAVLGMLRHLIQHRPRFKVLLAGAHTLDELERWSSYLLNVQVIPISYLQPAEARQLIEQPVRDFALQYEPAARQRVLDLTRGHPLLVQLLCSEIVVLKNEQDIAARRHAQVADVEQAIPAALAAGSLFFADIARNQVPAAGRPLLHRLAGEGPGAVLDPGSAAPGLSSAAAALLPLLVRRELLEVTGAGYRFQVELIRRWFAQAHLD
jgi:AAA+ ATPase superfamily predicted ATPase